MGKFFRWLMEQPLVLLILFGIWLYVCIECYKAIMNLPPGV